MKRKRQKAILALTKKIEDKIECDRPTTPRLKYSQNINIKGKIQYKFLNIYEFNINQLK